MTESVIVVSRFRQEYNKAVKILKLCLLHTIKSNVYSHNNKIR